jgi:uridine kinase
MSCDTPRRAQPVLVGIAGGSASGKTTLVHALQALLSGFTVSLLHHDDYYLSRADLPLAERARLNFDRPSSLDNRRLERHLKALSAGRPVPSPCYCFVTHSRLRETRRVEPAGVIVVEGMLLLAIAPLRRLLDVKVFVDAPADVRLARRVLRDTGPERGRQLEAVVEQYLTTVRPMHERYVEPSRTSADLVVTDATAPSQARQVAALVKRRLSRRRGRAASCAEARPRSRR